MPAAKRKKPEKLPDLSEYAEEAVPFDVVIRKIASAPPPAHPPKRKAKKRAK